MRVLCVRLIGPVGGLEQTESAWFTLHREYLVLSVLAGSDGSVKLRLIGDDRRTPVLAVSEMFLTVDESIPENWTAKITEGGVLDLAPARWHAPGFWERYFDRDQSAEQIFDEELAVIKAASQVVSP